LKILNGVESRIPRELQCIAAECPGDTAHTVIARLHDAGDECSVHRQLDCPRAATITLAASRCVRPSTCHRVARGALTGGSGGCGSAIVRERHCCEWARRSFKQVLVQGRERARKPRGVRSCLRMMIDFRCSPSPNSPIYLTSGNTSERRGQIRSAKALTR